MATLDLSDNTILEITQQGFLLIDPRDIRRSRDTDFMYRMTQDADGPRVQAILLVLEAGRVGGDGVPIPVTRTEMDVPKESYGPRVLEGTVWYADGVDETWEIQMDPRHMRLHWTRHPRHSQDSLAYRFLIPGRSDHMQAFFAGRTSRLDNRHFGTEGMQEARLDSSGETELLFYSLCPKNGLRMEVPLAASLEVTCGNEPGFLPRNEVDWKHAAMANAGTEFAWRVRWQSHPSSVHRIRLDLGTVPAINSFQAAGAEPPTDATLDIGPFYSQAYLGAMIGEENPGDSEINNPARLREIVLGAEFMYLCAPATTKRALENALDRYLPAGDEDLETAQVAALRHEDLALLLMAAGQHTRLAGSSSFVYTRLPTLRLVGERLLNLRRPGDALPTVSETFTFLGGKQVKEPYFTAIAFAGLNRMTTLARDVGAEQDAVRWETAAHAMRTAARSPWPDGGLWNDKTDAFIDCMYFEQDGNADDAGRPRKEFAHYQVMSALWLGLVESPADIRKAFRWLDYTFTYAAGRGGPTFPPDTQRSFFLLLDAYLRRKYDVSRADTLLQRIVDRSLDGGIPFTRAPFGAMTKIDAVRESGGWFDNAPFFGLVLQLHYGLEYDHRGWHLGDPQPLPDYPLTRVTELRHAAATYSVTWQGAGRIRRVLLNGAALNGRVLSRTEGDHEVNVVLGA